MNVIDVAEFPSQRDAEAASAILREAGIAFQLRADEAAVVIVVPERAASAAIELLMYQEQTQAHSSPQPSSATCPECAGHESHPLNRRVLYVLALMVATGGGLIASGYAELAFATMVLFGPPLAWFGKDLGKRKCARCGWISYQNHDRPLQRNNTATAADAVPFAAMLVVSFTCLAPAA